MSTLQDDYSPATLSDEESFEHPEESDVLVFEGAEAACLVQFQTQLNFPMTIKAVHQTQHTQSHNIEAVFIIEQTNALYFRGFTSAHIPASHYCFAIAHQDARLPEDAWRVNKIVVSAKTFPLDQYRAFRAGKLEAQMHTRWEPEGVQPVPGPSQG